MGGGTTGVVSKNLNRNYIGFEINDTYVEEFIKPKLENNNNFWE